MQNHTAEAMSLPAIVDAPEPQVSAPSDGRFHLVARIRENPAAITGSRPSCFLMPSANRVPNRLKKVGAAAFSADQPFYGLEDDAIHSATHAARDQPCQSRRLLSCAASKKRCDIEFLAPQSRPPEQRGILASSSS